MDGFNNKVSAPWILIALASSGVLAGCASPRWLQWRRSEIPSASRDNPVSKIVCIWEAAEGQGIDGLPTRGFAGQILFFTRGEVSPVKVDGTVRIYVYDDLGTPEEQAKPIHQFDFEGDAWNRHLQLSTLGPAYNVFVPYTRKHSQMVNCALRVRLTSSDGAVVFSDMVKVTLPGGTRPDSLLGADAPPGGRGLPELKASLRQERVPAMDATTLTLPESLAARAVLTRPRAGTFGTFAKVQSPSPPDDRPTAGNGTAGVTQPPTSGQSSPYTAVPETSQEPSVELPPRRYRLAPAGVQ